jgi:hypothetical protein
MKGITSQNLADANIKLKQQVPAYARKYPLYEFLAKGSINATADKR